MLTVADALSCLDIDSLNIQENKEEELTYLRIRKHHHQQHQINNSDAYCLDLQRTSKSQGCYSIQNIEGYDILYYKEKI
jgi:hypothetical protein